MKAKLFSDKFEKKKNKNKNKNNNKKTCPEFNVTRMADAEWNFQPCSFLSEFHISQIILLPKHR